MKAVEMKIEMSRKGRWLIEFRAIDSKGREVGLLQVTQHKKKFMTEFIKVMPSMRRRGIASKLLEEAEELLGYFPAPREVLPGKEARLFWKEMGY